MLHALAIRILLGKKLRLKRSALHLKDDQELELQREYVVMSDSPSLGYMFWQGPTFCNFAKSPHTEFIAPVLKSSDFSKL